MTPFEAHKQKLLQAFNERGYNLYARPDDENHDPEVVIKKGPAKKLVVDQGYVLLPVVENPANPSLVWEALDKLAVRLCRRMPEITIKNERFVLSGFRPEIDHVELHTPEGRRVSYVDLVRAIPSYPPGKMT